MEEMSLDAAKHLLNKCVRGESRDHAFGDAEVFWERAGKMVAEGYFSTSYACLSILDPGGEVVASFNGEFARELRNTGTTGHIGRNDTVGPNNYTEGKIMPGLTLEGVRQELTGG